MNTATSGVLAVRVVLASGKRFHKSHIPLQEVAKAIGSNARTVPLPWRKQDDQDNFDITLADDRELASLAREIVASMGWNDEGLILVYTDPAQRAEALSAQDISEPLDRISGHARTFGVDINFLVHLLDMDPDGREDGFSPDASELAEKVALAIGGSCLGAMSYPDDGDLADCLKRNLFLRALGSAVLQRMAAAGLRASSPDAADALVQGYVERVRKNGFDLDFQSDASIQVLAPE